MPSPEVISVCHICGGTGVKPLRRYSDAHLVRCDRCGLVFSSREPTDEEIARNYAGYPRTDFDSPITRQRYRELLDSFEPYRRTGRILDVGCGIGFFLEESRRRGWDPCGTEYGDRVVQINRAKGLDVVDVSLGPAAFESGGFDVITAFEVIEHVRDPRGQAQEIARLLRNEGLLYCTTPNFNALSRRILGSRWGVIEYPEHLNYFTGPTLSRLFEGEGFVAVKVTSSGVEFGALCRRTPAAPAAKSASGADGPEEPLRAQIEGSPVLRGAKKLANAFLGTAGAGDALKGRFELREAQ